MRLPDLSVCNSVSTPYSVHRISDAFDERYDQ